VSASAVAFAYHDVGARCLAVLLAQGVRIPLVVTHRDDPGENVWFASVERLARFHGLDVAIAEDLAEPRLAERVAEAAPDFVFSFYFRRMLPARLLAAAGRGAFNMHGSLLPKYRGRAPVNWAILHGERETGATLHEMAAKPDAGRIVDQMAVPILPDDLAIDVFRKVTVAAELVLHRSLPRLLQGTATLSEQDLAKGSYYGGRRPEDGRIDWSKGARAIHDLVRAVAPPYPGAFTAVGGRHLRVLRTRVGGTGAGAGRATLHCGDDGRLVARCADGAELLILESEIDGQAASPSLIRERLGTTPLPLGESA
jgi:methionyl-tRNA formyltransferase